MYITVYYCTTVYASFTFYVWLLSLIRLYMSNIYSCTVFLYFSSAFMMYARAFPFVNRGGSRQTIAATCIYDTYEIAILLIAVMYS